MLCNEWRDGSWEVLMSSFVFVFDRIRFVMIAQNGQSPIGQKLCTKDLQFFTSSIDP